MKLPYKITKWKSGQTYFTTPKVISNNLIKNDIWMGEFLDREDTALLLTSPNKEWEITQKGDKIIISPKITEEK